MNLEQSLFVAFLVASFAIGALSVRAVKSIRDYFVAGARMPWYFLTGTFIASNVSAGLFLGATDMIARHGYALWCSYWPTAVGYLVAIGVVGVLVRRMADHYEIYDFADILATRYSSRGNAIRAMTILILPLVYIPGVAAQFMALAAIAEGVFGLPYETVLTVIAVIVVAYTLLGGMLGVVWTDGFQFLVLLFGLILAVPVGMTALGSGSAAAGWERITALPPELFDWRSERWPWFLVMGQMVWAFSLPAQPHLVTRFLTARSERDIMIALPVCLVAGFAIYASTVPLGLLGRLAAPDLQPGGHYYIELARGYLGPGLGAMALAGIAAAALSTASTALIVTGQSLSREIYQKWLVPDASDRAALLAARIAVLGVGVLTLGLAWFKPLGIFWLVLLSASLLASVFFVPMLAGLFWRRASAVGALWSMGAGAVACAGVYAYNRATGSHLFASDLFAGLLASAAAMGLASLRCRATDEELTVMRAIGRY